MGDAPQEGGRAPPDPSRAGRVEDGGEQSGKGWIGGETQAPVAEQGTAVSTAPFYSQYSSIPPPQQRMDVLRPSGQQAPDAYGTVQGQDHALAPFSMDAMAGALPDYTAGAMNPAMAQPSQHHAQQGLSGASTSALVYQLQQNLQYPVPPAAYGAQAPYGPGMVQSQHQAAFGPGQPVPMSAYTMNPNQRRSAGPSPTQQQYPSFVQQSQQFYYYPPSYGSQIQPALAFQTHPDQQGVMGARRSSVPFSQAQMPIIGREGGIGASTFHAPARVMSGSTLVGDSSFMGSAMGYPMGQGQNHLKSASYVW